MLDNVAIEEVGGPGFMYMPEIVFASQLCVTFYTPSRPLRIYYGMRCETVSFFMLSN